MASAFAANAAHALTGQVSVTNVTFVVDGLDLLVKYNAKIDGQPTTGITTVRSDYRFAAGVQSDAGAEAQAVPGATAGDFTIRLLGGAANAGVNSRYFFRVSDKAASRRNQHRRIGRLPGRRPYRSRE